MDEKPRIRPWQWPAEWFTNERFWREVAAQALAGVIVLALGYFFAVLAGYVKEPEWRHSFATPWSIFLLVEGGLVPFAALIILQRSRKAAAVLCVVGAVIGFFGYILLGWLVK